jgi:hypothetical protein
MYASRVARGGAMSTSAPRVLRSRTGQVLERATSSDSSSARARRVLKNKSGSIQKPAHPPARVASFHGTTRSPLNATRLWRPRSPPRTL